MMLLGDLPLLMMETSSSKSQRHRRSRATSTARLRGPPNETRQTTCTARRVAAQRVEDGGKHRQLLRLRAAPQETAQAPLDDATCDSLIGLFESRPRDAWRRMIAASKEWSRIEPSVLARLQLRANNAAGDEELNFLKLKRLIKETSDEVKRFADLFHDFLSTESEDWEAMAAQRRTQLSDSFFDYLQIKISAMDPETQAAEREELATAAVRLQTLVQMHDAAVKDADQLEESFKAIQGLLDGASSVSDIDSRLDSMMAAGKLDPALLLTAAKLHMSVKESPYVQEEVKDIMAHLYWRMKAGLAEQQPKTVRILKHLLTIEDPMERASAMDQAFTPGPELSVDENTDLLFCTPQELVTVIQGVLKAYETQRGRTNMTGQAAELMTPQVIERMRALMVELDDRYL